jgi:DNA polymerase-3 subunit alpha
MGLQVLGPDVNESLYKFTVNDDVRLGWALLKEGSGAVATIVENRKTLNTSLFFAKHRSKSG